MNRFVRSHPARIEPASDAAKAEKQKKRRGEEIYGEAGAAGIEGTAMETLHIHVIPASVRGSGDDTKLRSLGLGKLQRTICQWSIVHYEKNGGGGRAGRTTFEKDVGPESENNDFLER